MAAMTSFSSSRQTYNLTTLATTATMTKVKKKKSVLRIEGNLAKPPFSVSTHNVTSQGLEEQSQTPVIVKGDLVNFLIRLAGQSPKTVKSQAEKSRARNP